MRRLGSGDGTLGPQNRKFSRMMGSMTDAATLQGDREETIQGGGREDTGGLCQSDKVVKSRAEVWKVEKRTDDRVRGGAEHPRTWTPDHLRALGWRTAPAPPTSSAQSLLQSL